MRGDDENSESNTPRGKIGGRIMAQMAATAAPTTP